VDDEPAVPVLELVNSLVVILGAISLHERRVSVPRRVVFAITTLTNAGVRP
jgi:hypothetical protein